MCQYVNMPIGLRRPKKQAAAQLAYWHISILVHYSLFRSRIKCTDAKRQPAELYPACAILFAMTSPCGKTLIVCGR